MASVMTKIIFNNLFENSCLDFGLHLVKLISPYRHVDFHKSYILSEWAKGFFLGKTAILPNLVT